MHLKNSLNNRVMELDKTYAKYKFNKHNNVIEKDGHTMFLEDVEKDLNRKSYLEKEVEEKE